MKFNDASEVEMLCYQMKLADYPRSLNRARINDLFNGYPPYTDQEVQANNIEINVNYLEGTRIAHDARTQFYGAFLKPGQYFKATTDKGAAHYRAERSTIVTREMNRIMKRSLRYFECFRSTFASDVLHGIGPAGWDNQDNWCPDPWGVEDVMVPANTYLTMKNLPFTAIYRSFTAPELIKLTRGPKVDPAWNMPLVDACLKWIDRETMALMGSNWPEVWSPEKANERVKGDGGFYVGDQVPTIDVWDLYFWDEDKNGSGWKRRMILDSWSTPASTGTGYQMSRRTGDPYEGDNANQFLYNPKSRKVTDSLHSIVTWQFADLSSVAPFRYHSVRSLGFLMYSICHLQNRLRCKFSEAVFENLLTYFRVNGSDDSQRALKIELANRGFIDSSVQFIPAAERHQINTQLVELGLQENAQLISANASSYTINPEKSQDKRDKTAFQVMSEMNSMTSLVSAALMQAYTYQTIQYREIFRRFCKKDSSDPEVRQFQAACLRQGVPERMLNPEAWEIEPERVMGGGNKSLEMAIAQQLMQYRNLYDPEPQRQILREFTLAITDDPARAQGLVPESENKITDSVFAAQLAAGSLMMGLPVSPKSGINNIDYVEALIADMAILLKKIAGSGGNTTMDQLSGLQNLAQHIAQHIQLIAQDPQEKDRVKQYTTQLNGLMTMVKQLGAKLAAQMKAQSGNGQMDPKDQAKIQAIMMTAQAKVQNTRESHAQRTAQRQIQWEMDQRRKQEQFQQDMQMEGAKTAQELVHNHARTRSEIHNNRLKAIEDSD